MGGPGRGITGRPEWHPWFPAPVFLEFRVPQPFQPENLAAFGEIRQVISSAKQLRKIAVDHALFHCRGQGSLGKRHLQVRGRVTGGVAPLCAVMGPS